VPLWLGLISLAALLLSGVAVAVAAWALTRPPVVAAANDGAVRTPPPGAQANDQKQTKQGGNQKGNPGKETVKAVEPLSVVVPPFTQKPLPADLLKKMKPEAAGGGYGARLRGTLQRHLALQGIWKVIPYSTAAKADEAPSDLARRHRARLVLRGTVEFLTENKLVTALELLDADTGALVWAETITEDVFYEWPLQAYLPREEKLAQNVTERLPLRQLRGERALSRVAVLPYLPITPTPLLGPHAVPQLNAVGELATRNLATILSRDRRLQVVSPNAIVRLKAAGADAGPEAVWSEGRRTGKRLGVDAVIEVTAAALVKRQGTADVNFWSLHVEMVEVETGTVLWRETLECLVIAAEGNAWPDTMPAALAARVPALLGAR
jgi:TolB-like protein